MSMSWARGWWEQHAVQMGDMLCKKNDMPGSKVAKPHKGLNIKQKAEPHERLDEWCQINNKTELIK